jgi:RNA polymerase sigma-70 factor (ECF subfamily)
MMANRAPQHDGGCHNEETELVIRLRAGDERALAELIAAFFSRLVGFAYTFLGSEDMAKDVAQQTFIRLWESRTSLDPTRPVKPYLFTLAKNQAISELRSRRVRERHEADARDTIAHDPDLATVPSAEEKILTTATIHSALLQLPERRRIAVRLRVEGQLSHAEIAQVLEISTQAAERLVQRGLQELRKVLRSFRVSE